MHSTADGVGGDELGADEVVVGDSKGEDSGVALWNGLEVFARGGGFEQRWIEWDGACVAHREEGIQNYGQMYSNLKII